MVELLKSIKNKLPLVWNTIEYFNGLVVAALYGRSIHNALTATFASHPCPAYQYRPLSQKDLPLLENLLAAQPEGFDRYFKPHRFDRHTLNRLWRNASFLMLGVFDGEQIVGYFFVRFFANRTAFRGKMVDVKYRHKGIAKEMGHLMTDIALGAGFRLFATISNANYGSMASSEAVNEIHIIKELPDNYLYIEYLKKC